MENKEIVLLESNFWRTTVETPKFPEKPLPNKVDVAIIGGGFTGLSAARMLAKSGVKVAILEAETIGWGASSRNGGMVLSGLKVGIETLIEKYGLEFAKRLYKASLDSINTVEKIIAEEKIECAFGRYGHLDVAWKTSHFDGFAKSAELLEKEFEHKVKIISKYDLHTEIGSGLYHGGLLDETSGGLNPAQYVMGLAKAVETHGALMFENCRVNKIEKEETGFLLKTTRGALKADKVFIATSGYTKKVTPHLQSRIIPVGSYIIATAPLPEWLYKEVIPNNRMIFDTKHYLYYFRLTPDKRMLFGGRAAFMPETESTVRESADILRRGMIEVFPQLKDIPVQYVWGGTLDFAYDMMPHAGQLDGMYHSVGYAGHGVAFATHFGKIMAEQILGKEVDNPLADIDFQKFPPYNETPWFLPFAGMYYKFLDLIS